MPTKSTVKGSSTRATRIAPSHVPIYVPPAEDRECATGDLVALDPSLVSPGIALFRGGSLYAAKRIRISVDAFPGARALHVAHEVCAWLHACGAAPRWLVYEWPQVYRAAKSKGDPNDLIGLAAVGGSLAGALAIAAGARNESLGVYSPTPAEWIGQLPKTTRGDATLSPRAGLILRSLSVAERAEVPAQHDAIDAVGLGLWALGRLNITRVFHGASPG